MVPVFSQPSATLPGCPELLRDPECIRDHEHILAAADASLARRRDAYPGLIARGGMSTEAAEADIAAWQALASEWRWICTGAGEPPHSSTLFDRIEAVDLANERAGAALARNPRDGAMQRQADLIEAMRWHLSRLRFGEPGIHFYARLNHQLRARASGQLLCATCERRADDPATNGCTRTDCGLKQKEAA